MSRHRISISEGTTWHSSYAEDLYVYRRAGAEGIGIWEWKLPEGQDQQSIALLRASGLTASVCFPAMASFLPTALWPEPPDIDARVDTMCYHVERLSHFQPDFVALVAGRQGGRSPREAGAILRKGLRRVADCARQAGVRLVFEPVRPGPEVLIGTIPETARLIEDAGVDNVGILADAWHLWDQPTLREDVSTYRNLLWAVQLGDAHKPIRSFADRVLPGDGGIDLVTYLQVLREVDYDGWYDIELLSDDGTWGNDFPESLWKRDPNEVSLEAVARVRAMLAGRRIHG